MSITNQNGDTLKAFARLKIDYTSQGNHGRPREHLKAGDWLETAYAIRGDGTNGLCLQTPMGSIVEFTAKEIEVSGDGRLDHAAAFACLTNTLRSVLDLEKPMDDQDRDRIGRWLLGKLFEGEPGAVRTIRDLSVGELIDTITDAQAPCIVV